ncbi:hypothetical protein [Actinophytocola sp. KF-1]
MSDDERTCGRPTRAGAPCRVRLSEAEEACGMHAAAAGHGPGRVFEVDGEQVVSVAGTPTGGAAAHHWRSATGFCCRRTG